MRKRKGEEGAIANEEDERQTGAAKELDVILVLVQVPCADQKGDNEKGEVDDF